MRNLLALALGLTLGLAGTSTAFATPTAPVQVDVARSQAALDQLLLRYDRTPAGAARTALAEQIDKVAAQKYATVSRLFWHTDLDAAEAEAARTKKPILALRMLGRLDEDLSCANSRFFRATLYANKAVSAYLKNNFVLYWSSEREVPKVTIDFGDGRTIESTTTGNSAHYILDATGAVLDVLPGLYSPRAFTAELAKSLAQAKAVARAPSHERRQKIIAYHQAKLAEISDAAAKLSVHTLRGQRVSAEMAVSLAQRATMSKAYVEVPQLRQITRAELAAIDEDEVATWASFGAQLWPAEINEARAMQVALPRGELPPIQVFDEQSLALIDTLHGDAPATTKAQMLERLALSVRADSALNQLRLRTQIAAHLAKGTTDFTEVNDFIYANVFHTPKSDPWLGLHTRTVFTGLPGDGVTMPAKAAQR